MNKIQKALDVAEKYHGKQKYDTHPYITHLKMVRTYALVEGFDETIQVACLLHDILEDTDCSYDYLEKEFGTEIAQIVYCVTDEDGRNRKEIKSKTYPKIKSNYKATIVKLFDRICNIDYSLVNSSEKKLQMYLNESTDLFNGIFSKEHPKEVLKVWDIYSDFLDEKDLEVYLQHKNKKECQNT